MPDLSLNSLEQQRDSRAGMKHTVRVKELVCSVVSVSRLTNYTFDEDVRLELRYDPSVIMRDLLLYASGTLGLALAFVHGLLDATRVFARARVEPERPGRLIRGVWHCSAVAWAGVAVLLIAAPWMGSQMARCERTRPRTLISKSI